MSHPQVHRPASRIGRRGFLSGAAGALGALALGAAESTQRPAVSRTRDMAMLEQLISTMEKDGPPWLALPRSDGRFLKLLAWVSRAQKVLEIGTSHGYGAIWLAAGLEETGGYLTTVEILAERMALARQHVEAAGLGKLVTFKEGDAHQILPTLQGPFDLVYINADKDGLPDYFSKLVPTKLSASGLLLAYGAIKQQEKMKPYLDMIQGRSDFTTVLLSTTMEDGFCVSARRTA